MYSRMLGYPREYSVRVRYIRIYTFFLSLLTRIVGLQNNTRCLFYTLSTDRGAELLGYLA